MIMLVCVTVVAVKVIGGASGITGVAEVNSILSIATAPLGETPSDLQENTSLCVVPAAEVGTVIVTKVQVVAAS